MSEPHETSGRPLASSIQQEQRPEHTLSAQAVPAPKDTRHKRSSTSSNSTIAATKSRSSQHHSGVTNESTTGRNAGPTRTAQQSTSSPNNTANMSTMNYTKTGRVSKAKKGLKVHDCQCGRSYTRAEHLRRHQRNHAREGAMFCKYPGCGKAFYRSDLLQRHEERHNEVGDSSRQLSVSSTDHSSHASPVPTTSVSLGIASINTLPPAVTYSQQQILSPRPEADSFSRYNPSVFRTPQLPRTPKVAPSYLSGHISGSGLSFKTPPNRLKQRNPHYSAPHSVSGPILADGGVNIVGHWRDSCTPSHYPSPILGPDYSYAYATPPYDSSMVRTRASSNASFIDSWVQGSQSPTSSISNVQYSWSTEEKSVLASSFSYMASSYPAVSISMHEAVDPMGRYGDFCPNNVVQMDHQEGAVLFPAEQYGMSQTMPTYQFEQYLNNYWRLFHPTFPIVHRFTFAILDASPMLYAAMIAIGAIHGNEICDKRIANDLHTRCIDLLQRRDQSGIAGCDRLCDLQAIFLVEHFAQYRARRCARKMSLSFMTMYKKLAGTRGMHLSALHVPSSFNSTSRHDLQQCWTQWATLSAGQHLLLSCYILYSQQTTLFARDPESSPQISIDNLPFPMQRSLWDAEAADEWLIFFQKLPTMPRTVLEAYDHPVVGGYQNFQAAVLIATHYARFSGDASCFKTDIDHLITKSPKDQHQVLVSRLIQLVPVRALLAVSGETWVLGTKVTSQSECTALKVTLQTWLGQLWSCSVHDHLQTTAEALQISIAVLHLTFTTPELLTLDVGHKVGLFVAGLVVWAATVASGTRVIESRLPSGLAMTIHPSSFSPIDRVSRLYKPNQAALAQPAPLDRRSSIPHSEIVFNISHFLDHAVEDIASFDVISSRTGCSSLLLWLKMHLRGESLHEQNPSVPDVASPGDFHGELVSIILGQIERMLSQGWEAWGI